LVKLVTQKYQLGGTIQKAFNERTTGNQAWFCDVNPVGILPFIGNTPPLIVA